MKKIFIIGLLLMISTTAVWAHGDDDNDDHHDEIDTSNVVIPENPTYYEHIQPLLELHCTACHSEGQIAGDIAIDTPEDAVAGSSDIAFNVSTGYMPPWMPSRLSLPMKHDRSLSNAEIATIIAWSDNGAPLGDPEDYVAPESRYELVEVRPDLILQLDAPYEPTEVVQDDYRCFAFPLDINETHHVTGYEFLPDITEMAHHGIVYLVGESAQRTIDRRDGEDGRAGWSCYGGVGLGTSSEMIGTWTPGTLPVSYPDNTGYRIEEGDVIVVQMHYNLAITRQPDQTKINLQLADPNQDIAELMTFELQAPVEIPCPTGVEGPQCDRNAALDRVAELYGQEWHYIPDGLLRECDQTIGDYVDNVGEDATTFCDYPVPASITVYGVLGHMHELGRSFQFELNPDSDNPIMLLDIPNWDFHWQDRYQFAEPLQLSRGDTLRMTCNWDNTLSDDPRYVVWGEGTQDEMCFGTIMILSP